MSQAESRELFASLSYDSTFSDTAITLNPTTGNDADIESLSLLSQIFPEESMEDLRRLHEERLLKATEHRAAMKTEPLPRKQPLPDDFLRLPIQTAVRRYHRDSGNWEYQLVKDLHRRVWRQLGVHMYSHTLVRHAELGLGITLTEGGGQVRIYAMNVKEKSSMQVGDILVGVNGYALADIALQRQNLLRQTVAFLKTCPSPVVLHLSKPAPPNSTVSLLDETLDESMQVDQSFQSKASENIDEPPLHPFAAVLSSHGFLTTPAEEIEVTATIRQFTDRARQWEFSNSFRIDAKTFELLPNFEEQTENVYSSPYASSPARSVPASATSIASSISSRSSYPGMRGYTTPTRQNDDVFIPLMGVRKALSVRILNTFLDGNYTAYTIWVHDIESGREWYAPLRYFRDFQDLRAAALNLRPGIGKMPFPSQGWSLSFFGSPSEANDTEIVRESKCRQLEYFLRTLCTMIYTEPLHPAVAEVAIHVQSFLGCDGVLDDQQFFLNGHLPAAATTIEGVHHTREQWRLRTLLKRQVQMFTHRVFLLEAMGKLVDHFVDTARANGPSLKEIEVMQAKSRNSLKKHATEELKRIQAVMDRLQEFLLDGCMDDFRLVAHQEQYNGLHGFLSGKGGEAYLDRLAREAVREQIEIEVYLPLRGTTSRLLVNAWRHEDMEVSFKVQELRKRPQDYFRIPVEDDENWNSVSGLLKNVSLSTLPCAKLRAIVDAATEISRLYRDEQADTEKEEDDNDPKHLGADDFLPIFIFCVIRAEMERPCALCALLRALCDPINRMGEVGYYLASFEAAITHIREMDLSESREEMFSFLSIPLSDSSFG